MVTESTKMTLLISRIHFGIYRKLMYYLRTEKKLIQQNE